jgi:hypothetical protein
MTKKTIRDVQEKSRIKELMSQRNMNQDGDVVMSACGAAA